MWMTCRGSIAYNDGAGAIPGQVRAASTVKAGISLLRIDLAIVAKMIRSEEVAAWRADNSEIRYLAISENAAY
jgi:hypothetical protein